MDEHGIAGLFTVPVSVCIADGDMFSAALFAEEEHCIRKAIPTRRGEFSAGRAAARKALERSGAGVVGPIAAGVDRNPSWPARFRGSITHCDGFCSAVVAQAVDADGVGLDAEGAEPLESGVHHLVCRPNDLDHFRTLPRIGGLDWLKLAFSAKESFYKCYYPIARTMLGFRDVSITFSVDGGEPGRGTFSVLLENRSKPLPRDSSDFVGHWVADSERVYTGVTLPRL